MAELVMLDLPPGPAFVEALQRVWEAGDAIFPLDPRLPAAEAANVISVAKPTAVIEADGQRRSLDSGHAVAAGDALMVATSGTTGHPKAVIHTHDGVRASALATNTALDVNPTSDVWLAVLPPAHIGGLAVITRSLISGVGLIAHERFDAALVPAAVEKGATLTALVTRALNQVDTTLFRRIIIGGAAPPPDRPKNVLATWGMTETGSGCVYDGWPLDGVELRTTDDDEIAIRAPLLFRAYRTRDGEYDARDDDGWFLTGDLGRVEESGRLWVDGRRGDVINTGAEKVWPSRVEPLLATHPSVREVAVVGRPDPEWGHRVVAIIAVEGTTPPSLAELRDLVKSELPVWHAPKEIEIVQALPRTAIGKVRRGAL